MAGAPLPRLVAWRAVARCGATTMTMLARRQIHLPRSNVGRIIRFADGTSGRVYRETVVDRVAAAPCVLLVGFRLKVVRGRRGHALFRRESILNTPLFVGFPGFVSKLWIAHDDRGVYRGLYEWDGTERAEHYARCLWRVLELVCEGGSINYRVVAGRTRHEVFADPRLLHPSPTMEEPAWRRIAT